MNMENFTLLIIAIAAFIVGFMWGRIYEDKDADKMREKWRNESDKNTALLHFVCFNCHRFTEQEMENFHNTLDAYNRKSKEDLLDSEVIG